MTTKPSSDYYRRRAIAKKIMREGTGLQPALMTDKHLMLRLRSHCMMMLSWMEEENITVPELARAAWEADAIACELDVREHQLSLFG